MEEAQAAIPPVPLLVFDLAGGAALIANFLVGGPSGPEDLIKSYSLLGWNPRASGLDKRFGLPMPPRNISKILDGMLQRMSPEAQARFRFGSIVHSAAIDVSSNPLSIISIAGKAGSTGSMLRRPLGLVRSKSGGNSSLVTEIASQQPMIVDKLETLLDLANSSGRFGALSKTSREALAKALTQLSESQARDLLRSEPISTQDQLIKNYGGIQNLMRASAADLDPRINPVVSQIYGLNQNSPSASVRVLRSALVFNVLTQKTGPGVITIGGCDYHDDSQTTGDAKDLEIGLEIGNAIEAAHRLKTPLFIQIITDGGIYSVENTRRWRGDSVEKCMTVIGYYHPSSAPEYQGRIQVGSFNNDQGSDGKGPVKGNAALAGYAAFANYLNVAGLVQDFSRHAPGVFSPEELDSVLILKEVPK